MPAKPWLQKTFLDRRRSSELDYPPKRKKFWLADNFAMGEQFHYETFGPIEMVSNPLAGKEILDTTHWVILRPLTGSSDIDCESDVDGTRQFEILFLRIVNNGPLERVPIKFTVYDPVDIGNGEYTLEDNIVTVGINEPGNEFWSFRMRDTETDSSGFASGSIFVEERIVRHNHWRLYITDKESPSFTMQIMEIEFRETISGDNKAVSGTASASSFRPSPPAPPSRAFDGDLNTFWQLESEPTGALPQWIRYSVATPYDVAEYTIAARTPTGPKTWELQWSDDGSIWTAHHSGSTGAWDAGITTRTFTV